MLAYLDERLSLRTVIWLFPLAFILHDGEELLTMGPWWQAHRATLPLVFLRSFEQDTPQVAVAIGLVLIVVLVATMLAARRPYPGTGTTLFAAVVGVMFAHVFTHLGQAIVMRGYTPGVLTAPTIALPYSSYALRRLRAAGLIDPRSLIRTILIGAAIAIPMVVAFHLIGHLIA